MEQIKTVLRARLKETRTLFHQKGLYKNADKEILKKSIIFLKQQKPDLVLCYYAIGSEVHTKYIMQYCLDENIHVALPVSFPNGVMEFYEVKHLDDCTKGMYGIMEPARKLLITSEKLKNTKKVIVFLPGLGFDLSGGRIGYGGGYYDRFLARYPEIMKVALAYTCQFIPEIPKEATDVSYDLCITE